MDSYSLGRDNFISFTIQIEIGVRVSNRLCGGTDISCAGNHYNLRRISCVVVSLVDCCVSESPLLRSLSFHWPRRAPRRHLQKYSTRFNGETSVRTAEDEPAQCRGCLHNRMCSTSPR